MKFKSFVKRSIILIPAMIAMVLLSYLIDNYINSSSVRFEPNIAKIKQVIEEKENKAHRLLVSLSQEIDITENSISIKKQPYIYADLYDKEGIALYISKEDSLVFWTTHLVPFDISSTTKSNLSDVVHLKNGWYLQKKIIRNQYVLTALILIKTEYKYQNDYLVNEFNQDFELPNYFTVKHRKGLHNIINSEGKFLFSLQPDWNIASKMSRKISIPSILLCIGSFVLLIFIYLNVFKVFSVYTSKNIGRLVFLALIILTRYFLLKFQAPDFLFSTPLFSPQYYATSELLPSLGDLLINLVFFLIIIQFLCSTVKLNSNINVNNRSMGLLIACASYFSIYFFNELVLNLIKGLIINSNISLSTSNIFQLTTMSYLGFFIIGLIFLAYFLLFRKLNQLIWIVLKENRPYIFTFLITYSLFLLIKFIFINNTLIFVFLPILLFFIYWYLKRKGKQFLKLGDIVTYIILFTFFTTLAIYDYSTYKEKENRISLAIKLAAEQDPLGEFLYQDIVKSIKSDISILYALKSATTEETQLIKQIQSYFTDYWSKYDIQITICRQDESITILPSNQQINCTDFFTNIINSHGKPTISENLYFLNNESGRNSYISKITFFDKKGDGFYPINIYIELDSKFIPKELGYPELLIDKEIKINRNLQNYSYVKYKNNELLSQYGNFFYSISPDVYGKFDQDYTFFSKDKFSHLFYKIDENTSLIVSKREDSWLEIIAPFSYLFVFYLLCISILIIIQQFPKATKNLKFNFKNKVQFSMVFIVILTFVLIGSGTIIYIVTIYNKKNYDTISEKTHSVLVEVENILSSEQKITPEMKDYITNILIKLSGVYFTDINLFDLQGSLIASSRQKIFDEGLVSKKMDALAFYNLSKNKITLFEHNEKIGKLNYVSAYVPFRNNQNQLIAYLNVPYFAKQSELKKEISSFVVTFINIYVLLVGLTIIIALIISNYITNPLKIIKDKLGQFKLGKSNEKLEWKSTDEIGSLINEYNRMIDELAKSAELLAKSERELAWREMAKQIAHEIKNPLTPMKLSVQYLQKAWKDNAPNWDERLERFSKSIIEQIDSLSRIASEFSDFAKMPDLEFESIDMNQLISQTIDLYKDFETVNIESILPRETIIVNSDRRQILRVFNNLIKNSMQAMTENSIGKIKIELNSIDDYCEIKISDNGIGIAEDQIKFIFSPYFTTKTSGMGLGLAMVKSIVESLGGKINFESQVNIGTTFIILLPKSKNINQITHL